MPNQFFLTPIGFLKGVGPDRAVLLEKELGIKTFGDLLYHFPFRYADRSRYYKVKEITPDLPYVQLRGTITSLNVVGNKPPLRLVGTFKDDSGTMELLWFQGVKWMQKLLQTKTEYVIFGKPTVFNKKLNIVHPEIEIVSPENVLLQSSLQAVYNTTEKLKMKFLDSRSIQRLQQTLSKQLPPVLPETLSDELIEDLKMLSLREALQQIHFPENLQQLQKAEFRLKFEELFYNQLRLLMQKLVRTEKYSGRKFSVIGEHFNNFYKHKLPFQLTNAQKRVIKEIRTDTGTGKQMNRLLQGDVGSGKTLVAYMCMLISMDNGYQNAIMAPTEILAQQHYRTISKLADGSGVSVALLTGSTKSAERKRILQGISDGSIHILIGTHALIENDVQFKNPGLVVIDEQHRFGVEQRSRLWSKNSEVPHVLVMTATPIPRTLAMTLYGDLDVSVIDELPPGRKPVTTVHRFDSSRIRVFGFLKEQIAKGRQIYIVYPLIEESETMDYKDLTDGYDAITREFPRPEYHVSMVHGKMKPAEKEFEMQRFIKGETHIMVATTVIEVGVDVPNASVMVIESAERFGLSQLHQLRGRVGRGAEQSYCILMTGHKLSKEAKLRIDTMVETNDGFRIAETDLRLRGAGDIQGTQQSGILEMKIADIARDVHILQAARNKALDILTDDPHLAKSKNERMRSKLMELMKAIGNWGRVS